MTQPHTESADGAFAALGLHHRLVQALAELGYEEPTPIQREAIPPLLEGRDLVGQAATGTGKTAAFALPLIQRIGSAGEDRPHPSALILVPTRELAMQVSEAVHRYGRSLGVTVMPVYGGQSFGQQLRGLKRGVDVVVATPGRALDHIRRDTLRLNELREVVLDEADEMLDMGFAEDLDAILAATPEQRQTVLFSATMPPRIAAIAKRHLDDPIQLRVAREKLEKGAAPKVRQTAYVVPRAHKPAALARLLDLETPDAAIVFCRTRNEVDELAQRMSAHGYRAEALHGGLSQDQRDRVMERVRGGAADLLVATDVAARGLDIPRLTHVINYDVPNAAEAYVHRIGRVGRAGREGVAITLTEPREHRFLRNIEQLIKAKIAVAQVPTIADVHARRLELVRASIRETLLTENIEGFRVVVESLADEFDPMQIAMAAVKMAHDASGVEAAEEVEIPSVSLPTGRDVAPRQATTRDGGRSKGRKARQPGRALDAVTDIYVGAGRHAGVRPQDLVGAITGEAGVPGSRIGAIEIADRFSMVEVDSEIADEVIAALRSSAIKGKKVTVRREKGRKR